MNESKSEPGHKPILKPMPRLNLFKQTECASCGDLFDQLKRGKRRTCPTCRLVNTSKGGKR